MLNSQSSILARLQQLQVSEEIQEFICDIMNFYKSHISKLQQIIVQKQTQIDDIYNMKDNNEDYNKRFEEELEILKQKNRELIEENIAVIKEKEEMKFLIQSQQDDIANLQFDIKVKDDDLKNFQNRFQMLEKQNDMLLKENLNLKNPSDFNNTKNDTNYQELIQEIMELKYQLKNQSKNFNMTSSFINTNNTENNYQSKPRSISPSKRLQSVSVERVKDKPERHYQKTKTMEVQNQFQSSINNPLQNDQRRQSKKQDTYETEEFEVEKLNEYLQFLQSKEKQLQNDLWKYPSRPRSKMDKDAKKQIEKQLEEVIQEIHSIKHTLKNKNNQIQNFQINFIKNLLKCFSKYNTQLFIL